MPAGAQRTPNPGFAYTDAYVFDDRTGRVARTLRDGAHQPADTSAGGSRGVSRRPDRSNFVYVSTVVPRTVLDHVGGFDETRTSCEDYELWLRILIAGYRVAWVPGRQALYRKHPGQMSHDLTVMTATCWTSSDDPGGRDADARATASSCASVAAPRAGSCATSCRWPDGPRCISSLELKRLGVSESWYETPPAEVAQPFPDLRLV